MDRNSQNSELNRQDEASALNAARGAVIGALAADAAGSTLEFIGRKPTKAEVERAMQMVGGGAWRTAPGQVTDDGELTLALAHALAGESAYPRERVAAQYCRWIRSDPFDVGLTTRRALDGGEPDQALLANRFETNAHFRNMASKANGSLMRVSVLGAWSSRLTIEEAVSAAHSDALLTHPNPSCQWAGAAYVVAIRHLLLSPGDASGAVEAAQSVLSAPEASEVAGWLADASKGILPDCHPQAGFVRIAFTYAFFHLIRQSTYAAAIFNTLEGGGDSDTNACIVGGLIGALQGESGIPEIMRSAVFSCDTRLGRPRPEWMQTARLDELLSAVFNTPPGALAGASAG